jgi:hypothetical protein
MTRSEASAITWRHCPCAADVHVRCHTPGVALVLVEFRPGTTRDQRDEQVRSAQNALRENGPIGVVINVQPYCP